MAMQLYCPQCGRTNPPDVSYCTWCSKQLPVSPGPIAEHPSGAYPASVVIHKPRRNPIPFLVGVGLCLVGVLAFLTYWSVTRTNDSPPASMKTVAAYKEGTRALGAYFILADKTGAETSAGGNVTVVVTEETARGKRQLLSQTYRVEKKDFVKTRIGEGASGRDAVLCTLGPITYDWFAHEPRRHNQGGMEITFIADDGTTVTGSDTLSFDR